nr:MAG TPA: hypothetical protein [Caudoviricetes sp.]
MYISKTTFPLFDKYVDNYKNKNSWIKIPMSFYFALFFISYT